MDTISDVKKRFKDYFIEMLTDPLTKSIAITKVMVVVFAIVQVTLLGVFIHIVYRLLLGENDPTTTGDSAVLAQMIQGGIYNGIFILLLAGVIKWAEATNLKTTLQNNPPPAPQS